MTINIQWQIVAVNDTHYERQILRDEVVILFSYQDSSNVKSQVIFSSVVVLVEILWNSVWNVQNGVENNLTISIEMNPIHRRVRLFAQALEEIDVVLFVDFIFVS